ncbi:bifunctional biotin operon-related protein and biotin-acetyl-CoA-carboxylase, partial [Staphylococcus simiae CCM 7213 = CCUG 51256]
IGINMMQQQDDFSDAIKHRATSIQLHNTDDINRYHLLQTLLHNIEYRYRQFLTLPFSDIRDEYKHASNIWNRTLTFTENDQQFEGQAVDIDEEGYLIVQDNDGKTHQLISADIEF